jgi:hypothetical protein
MFHVMTLFVLFLRLKQNHAQNYRRLISQSRLFSPKVAFTDDFVWNQLHAEAIDALAPSKFFNFDDFLEIFRSRLLLTAELVQ